MVSNNSQHSASARPRHLEFWSLNREPFAPRLNWPADRDLIFRSRGWQEAQARLRYVVEQKFGLAVVVGPVGSGKSLLLNAGHDRLAMQGLRTTVHACHPSNGSDTFPLGRSGDPETDTLLAACWQRLSLFETTAFDATASSVLLLDDVSALQSQTDILFRFVERSLPLLGGLVLTLPDTATSFIEQVANFAPLMIRLPALQVWETAEYLEYRFVGAGGGKCPFTDDAVELIQQHTAGVPRRVNRLAHECLLMATVQQRHRVDASIVSQIVSALVSTNAARPAKSQHSAA